MSGSATLIVLSVDKLLQMKEEKTSNNIHVNLYPEESLLFYSESGFFSFRMDQDSTVLWPEKFLIHIVKKTKTKFLQTNKNI